MRTDWKRVLKLVAARTGTLEMLRRVRDRYWSAPGMDLREVARTGVIALPSSATIEPTIGCNLRCPMCYQNDLRAGGFKDAPLDRVVSVLARLSESVRFVYLIGGEIFLRKDIFEILKTLERYGIEFFITSNGTLLNEERIRRLASYRKLVGLGISLDGTEEAHDSIRGPGTYARAVGALTTAASQFRVGVSSVLLPDNVAVAEDLMRAIARLGVREINFNLEIYCNEHDAAVTATALQIERRALAMEVKADPRASAAARLEQAVVRVEQAGRDLGMEVTFEPSVPRHQLASLLAGTIRETAFLSCRELTNLRIDPAGNVLPCGFIRKPFGNLLEQSLEDIWNGEAFRQFRIMLLGDNLLPACKRCCKLAVVSGKQDGASEKGSASYH